MQLSPAAVSAAVAAHQKVQMSNNHSLLCPNLRAIDLAPRLNCFKHSFMILVFRCRQSRKSDTIAIVLINFPDGKKLTVIFSLLI